MEAGRPAGKGVPYRNMGLLFWIKDSGGIFVEAKAVLDQCLLILGKLLTNLSLKRDFAHFPKDKH
jgi:hypothetical protein